MAIYDWHNRKNILCVRPDNLGDVLMTQPALRALKQSAPGRKITLLTSRSGAGVARLLPEIDEVAGFDLPWVKAGPAGEGGGAVRKIAGFLKRKKFDAAAIFTNFSQSSLPSAMLCYLAEIPDVLAYSRENPYRLINCWVADKEPFFGLLHGVRRQLELVRAVGAETKDSRLRMEVSEESMAGLAKKASAFNLDAGLPWLAVSPGASEAKRKYSAKSLGRAALALSRRFGLQVIACGLEGEKKECGLVAKIAGGISLAGRLRLNELAALIKLSVLLVSNNSGPAHIAAAVGTPVVVLYARTNPEHTPWKAKSRVLYFDVPRKLQSRNTILRLAAPKSRSPSPGWEDIFKASAELLGGDYSSRPLRRGRRKILAW